MSALDEVADDIARRSWLRHVAEESRLRGDAGLSDELATVVANELRKAFARVDGDLSELREAAASGESLNGFAARNPRSADRVRDLGRIAESLRGSGMLALCSDEACKLASDLARAMKPPVHLVPTVPEPLRVDRNDLLRWAQSDHGDKEFPRLVRSLIAETEPSAEWIDMPAGTGVSSSGWDGVVRCDRGNRFVPVGDSVWELTTKQRSTHGKSAEDYLRRVNSSTPDERAATAYVSAACAPWTKKRLFESERTGENDFHRVRALNVDDLEGWLECAVATTVWMRDQIDKPIAGIRLLARWWENWLAATTTPLDADLVLAGREKIATDLRDRRKRSPGVLTVGGQVHRDEILAFVAAALVTADVDGIDVDHFLFVDDHETAHRLFAQDSVSVAHGQQTAGPVLTMVVPSADFARHLPAGSPHRMIVPIPGSTQCEIVLNPVDSGKVSKHFEIAGEELHTAHRLGALARMSLLALRRRLSVEPALHVPSWATGTIDQAIRRSVLLGGWNEAREGDHEIVARFVGRPYEEVTEALQQLDAGDSPMTSTGEVWHAVSPADSWMLLRDQLAPSDLDEFVAIALDVLPAPDPLRELSGEDALRAQIEGVRPRYSSQLKHGIATTLALAGSNPPTPRGVTTPTSNFAEGLTRRLLRSAMEDATPRTWIAVTDTLPLIAEAAPEAVLEALRTCIAEQHAYSEAMFTDRDDHFFDFSASSPHFQILNALEVIAWSPDHLLAATDVFARLAAIDPDGRYANRPRESLASVMCPWMPHTWATVEDRLSAVRMLRRSHPRVAWPLMLSMLPSHHSVQTSGTPPRYRDWRPSQPVVTPGDYALTTSAIASMLIDDVGEDPERWIDLIGRVGDLPAESFDNAGSALGEIAVAGADETYKTKVWPALREFVQRHRRFHDAEWALPAAELVPFEHAMDALRPSEPSVTYADLFSDRLRYLDDAITADGYDQLQQALKPKQTDAVAAVLDGGGFTAVFELAAAVDQPHRVGSALARCNPDLDAQVLGVMDSAPDTVTRAALGYFDQRFASLGWDGVEQLLDEHDMAPQVVADVLRAPPPKATAWTRVDAYGTDVATQYWNRVNYYDLGIPDELDQLLEICRRLRGVGRLGLARTLLTLPRGEFTSQPEFAEEAAALLEQLVEQPDDEIEQDNMASWELSSLFKVLDDHRDHLGISLVAILEWKYHPLLHHDPEFSSPNLYREMLREPDLFVQFIELAFKPASTAPDERPTLTAARQQMALSAMDVLNDWPTSRFAPSIDDEDNLDATALNEWIDRTRKKLAAVDRADIGDQMIGAALASSPADPGGEWPAETVRDLLERLQNDHIDQGLYITIRNRRGVTSRSPTAGGDQERELAQTYRQQSRQYREWPRTAAIFASLARGYEHDAGYHDSSAETRRRGLPM